MVAKNAQTKSKVESAQKRVDSAPEVQEKTAQEQAGAVKAYARLSLDAPPPTIPGDLIALQASAGNHALAGLLRRKAGLTRPSSNGTKDLQRRGDGSFEAGSDVENRLAARRGGGAPLNPDLRAEMEQGFGADFSSVKVHSSAEDARLSRDLGAQAFTHGSDIYMGEGKFNPGTTAGKRLLAHELTHVIQQTGTEARRVPILRRLSARLQRVKAFTPTDMPTYQGEGDKVKAGKFFGKARTGEKIPRMSIIDIADQPAQNDRSFFKLNTPVSSGAASPAGPASAQSSAPQPVTPSLQAPASKSAPPNPQAAAPSNAPSAPPASAAQPAAPAPGTFIEKPELITTIPAEKKAARSKTSLVNAGSQVDLLPGDVLEVSGTGKGYLLGRSLRGSSTQDGLVEQGKVLELSGGLEKNPADPSTDAAAAKDNVPFYQPADPDRSKSVGIKEELGKLITAGNTIKVDFSARGVDKSGSAHLIFAQSQRRRNKQGDLDTGYVDERQVRNVEAEKDNLAKKFSGEMKTGTADLEKVDKVTLVKEKTALRQYHVDAAGKKVSLNTTVQVKPGAILRPTNTSRVVVLEDRPWITDLLYKGAILGAVDIEKSARVEQAELDDLGAGKTPAALTKARIKGNAHLRAIPGDRNHSLETGSKTGDKLKADEIINVDNSIHGIDEKFSSDWIYAETSSGSKGYIRDSKITHDAKEGKVVGVKSGTKPVKKGKKEVEGNEIPSNVHYVASDDYQDKDGSVKTGDLLFPEPDAAATQDSYWNLRNQRTNGIVKKLPRKKAILSNPLFEKNPPALKKALVVEKTGLHEALDSDRAKNVGVSKTRLEQFVPGDRLNIDFESAGISSAIVSASDTGWHFAQSEDGKKGYVHSGKVQESSAEVLAEEDAKSSGAQPAQAPPDKFVPVFVTKKTTLRDKDRKKQESLKMGQMVLVNFSKHPSPTMPVPAPSPGPASPAPATSPASPAQSTAPVNASPAPPATGSALAQTPPPSKYSSDFSRWLLARTPEDANQAEDRYIHEYKVTARSTGLDKEAPKDEANSTGATVFEAANMLLKGAADVGAEYMMPDRDDPKSSDVPIPKGDEYYVFAGTGILGGIVGLMGVAGSIKSMIGERSVKNFLQGAIDISGNLANSVGAVAAAGSGIKNIQGEGDSDMAKMFDSVSSWGFGIGYAIAAVKDLFLLIANLFTNKSKKAKALESGATLLSASQNGLKAAQTILKWFKNPAADALNTAVPVIGIALNTANAILGFKKFVTAESSVRMAMKAQKSAPGTEVNSDVGAKEWLTRVAWTDNKLVQEVIGKVNSSNPTASNLPDGFANEPHVKEGDKMKSQLFWKEKRGIRSASTLYRKKLYYRVNPKVLLAIRNKDRLDRHKPDGTVIRSKDFYSKDYYLEVDANNKPLSVVVVFGDKTVKIDDSAEKVIEEYETASKVEEVSRKKATVGIETIETSIVNLVGDALTLGGISASVGAVVKGTMAAINAGFDFARFINKVVDSSQGKKISVALKYKGEVTGVDKSQNQKKREYFEHACFIMDQIAALPGPKEILEAAKDQSTLNTYLQQYKRADYYVDMTGVYKTLFYASRKDPKKQVDLLVESMSER